MNQAEQSPPPPPEVASTDLPQGAAPMAGTTAATAAVVSVTQAFNNVSVSTPPEQPPAAAEDKEEEPPMIPGQQAFAGCVVPRAYAHLFANEEKRESKMSWADIMEMEEDETRRLAEISKKFIEEDTPITNKTAEGIILPAGFQEKMPRWHDAICETAETLGLPIEESATVTMAEVYNTNLYSTKKDDWAAAKEAARQGEKELYASYNTFNQILAFMVKPIDLKGGNLNPGFGQGWVLGKMLEAKLRHELQVTSLAKELRMASFCNNANVETELAKRFERLISRGEKTNVAKLVIAALNKIVYKYIDRLVQSSKKDSREYWKDVRAVVQRSDSNMASLYTRSVETTTRKQVMERGRTKVVEQKKIAKLNPTLHKSDDLYSAEEQKIVKDVNDRLKDTAALIKTYATEDCGLLLKGVAAQKIMECTWYATDQWNSILKHRKKLVRNDVISNREAKSSGKITPEEWMKSVKTVMADTPSRNGEVVNILVGLGVDRDTVQETDMHDYSHLMMNALDKNIKNVLNRTINDNWFLACNQYLEAWQEGDAGRPINPEDEGDEGDPEDPQDDEP